MGEVINLVSAGAENDLASIGQNRLEQVDLRMPQVRFYFAGDREQSSGNLRAYIGTESLTLQSMQRFSETGEGICYYCLLDVSASISEAGFTRIKEALSDLSRSLRPQDQMVLLTFGEEVTLIFDESGSALAAGSAEEQILALTNRDQRTLLFEAVQQMAQLADRAAEQGDMRQAAFVITDGEDIAKGMATREEALQTLGEESIPVYGFAVSQAKEEYLNAFGEFSRASGGSLMILEDGRERESFQSVCDALLNSYEAVFYADSNRASNEMVSVSLEFLEEKEKQQTKVMQDRWIADTEAPVIQEVVCQSAGQIQVLFSEPVSGADAADNYRLETDTDSFLPAYASAGSDQRSVVLTFSEELPAGSYELSCVNIKDQSMEQNLLEGTVVVQIEGTIPEQEESPGSPSGYQAAGFLLAAILAAAGLFFVWKRSRGRKTVTITEGNVVLKADLEARQHVSMKTKKLEEKELFFHVAGQKEEIRVLLQKSMIVGRASSCELIFDDPALSRQHFALEIQDGEIRIQNLSQGGFTAVNGLRLGTKAHPLHSGDEISAGQLRLTVRW